MILGRILPRPQAPSVSTVCGAVHTPARFGARGDEIDPIVCTAQPQYDDHGRFRPHRGKHRTRLPGGTRLRWTSKENQK